ncbi:salicylic acid-binding 2 [Olea europaea subsp. europaea]|uniref:Salicylic acid-binding 2 n=1 Tax=Olea europaea subsp. europaea TaxID=158383 RepID=A0A8S0PP67_OLEEU|nr:salicylic acid-binding 2 [Olea europaea subsp. europaea]
MNRKMAGEKQQKHFVLVHGACHGAWCWYKLQSLLEAEGHRVTAIDLGASGINPKKLDELRTFADYTQPLFDVMESIPPDEKIVLVGHSLGGMNMAFAMEKYPQKISVAVFIAAMMPDTVHTPIYFFEQVLEGITNEDILDNQFIPIGRPEEHGMSMLFGPLFTSSKLYQLCPPEDVVLAKDLMRPISNFWDDLSNKGAFSNEKYGSVKRAYIIPDEDKTLKVEYQRWQIKNVGASMVIEMKYADHMAMISKPHELCQHLLDIAWDGKGPRLRPAKDFIISFPPQFPLKAGWNEAERGDRHVYNLIYILSFLLSLSLSLFLVLFLFKF